MTEQEVKEMLEALQHHWFMEELERRLGTLDPEVESTAYGLMVRGK